MHALYKRLGIINLSSHNAISLIEQINEKIDKVRIEIEKIASYRANGAKLRAKIKWEQDAGQSTKYFLHLEKHNEKMLP